MGMPGMLDESIHRALLGKIKRIVSTACKDKKKVCLFYMQIFSFDSLISSGLFVMTGYT